MANEDRYRTYWGATQARDYLPDGIQSQDIGFDEFWNLLCGMRNHFVGNFIDRVNKL